MLPHDNMILKKLEETIRINKHKKCNQSTSVKDKAHSTFILYENIVLFKCEKKLNKNFKINLIEFRYIFQSFLMLNISFLLLVS